MINSLLNLIITLVLNVLSFFINLILLPFTLLINTLFPNIQTYFQYFNDFLNTYVIKGVGFMREVFYNITGINRELMGIVFILPLTWFTFHLLNRSVVLLVKLYRFYKTGRDE